LEFSAMRFVIANCEFCCFYYVMLLRFNFLTLTSWISI